MAKTSSHAGRPTPLVFERLRIAAHLVATGLSVSEVSDRMGLKSGSLQGYIDKHRSVWQRLCDDPHAATGATAPAAPIPGPSDVNRDRMKRGALLVARDLKMTEASRRLGLDERTLGSLKTRHSAEWERELQRAKAEVKERGLSSLRKPKAEHSDEPTPKVLEKIRRATALTAAGLGIEAIAKELSVKFELVRHWKRYYDKVWKTESERALEAAVIMVRRHAGTDKVVEDPEAHIRRAMVCEKWCRARGEKLFPRKLTPTLASFYDDYYRPTRLDGAAPTTLLSYQSVLRAWVLLTGDPPLSEITVQTLTTYRDAIRKMRGRKAHRRMSERSVHRHLTHIQSLLDKAGPPSRGNRDAAGLIESAPWIRKPRLDPVEPRIPTLDQVSAVYRAAIAAEVPRLPGIKPAAWWRVLIAVTYNTGLRKRTLFEMRMDEIEWDARRIVLNPRRLKSRKRLIVHLNETAFQHLLSIRTDRELVFPSCSSLRNFHRIFHRLQNEAGLPAADHFGLHGLRKALATHLFAANPAAAQLALGHSQMAVTVNHYVAADSIVAAGLDQLQQPEAFASGPQSAG